MTLQLITEDQGNINERLVRRFGPTDVRDIESASRTIPTKLYSPEAKRLFVRFFYSMQVTMHAISVFGRLALPGREAEQCEEYIVKLLADLTTAVDEELIRSQKRFATSGVQSLGGYHIEPLDVDVLVFSSFGRRYLELICKTDQVMLMLETLALDEIISMSDALQSKARYKRAVRKVVGVATNMRRRLRRLARLPDRQQGQLPGPDGAPDAGGAGTRGDNRAAGEAVQAGAARPFQLAASGNGSAGAAGGADAGAPDTDPPQPDAPAGS